MKPYITKSKLRKHRGKYRAATTTLSHNGGDVTLTEVLWNDSSLVGCVSADLGSKEHQVKRRMGRHQPTIAQPHMMHVRDDFYRAVDQNDQLRMGKWGFDFKCKLVCWFKVFFALIELLLINVYIIAMQSDPGLLQDDYRWSLVLQLIHKAEELEAGEVAARTRAQRQSGKTAVAATAKVSRWKGGVTQHHHDIVRDYVPPEQASANQKIVDLDPPKTVSNKSMRKRDRTRMDGKVRNPMYTSASLCLVCKYVHDAKTWTTRHCRECTPQPNWPQTNRATGFQRALHPRLCSPACFKYFHTHRIPGLDFKVRSSATRTPRRRTQSRRTPAPATGVTGEAVQSLVAVSPDAIISSAIAHVNEVAAQNININV